jgi:hypothetical protein
MKVLTDTKKLFYLTGEKIVFFIVPWKGQKMRTALNNFPHTQKTFSKSYYCSIFSTHSTHRASIKGLRLLCVQNKQWYFGYLSQKKRFLVKKHIFDWMPFDWLKMIFGTSQKLHFLSFLVKILWFLKFLTNQKHFFWISQKALFFQWIKNIFGVPNYLSAKKNYEGI